MKQVRVHETLVQRLRKSVLESGHIYGIDMVSPELIAEKLNAIGEALAYIIEKKHHKRKVKLVKKRVKAAKRKVGLR